MMAPRILLVALLLWALPVEAKVFLTADEALALAFPGCEVKRSTVFLTDAQREQAEAKAERDLATTIIHPYEAACPDGSAGTAYFDVHRVRTLPETLMIVVDEAGRVRRIEVLSFKEPEDYLPKAAWYAQFLGRGLDAQLVYKHGIRPVAGATLTARATTDAVRRVLAVHEVIAR